MMAGKLMIGFRGFLAVNSSKLSYGIPRVSARFASFRSSEKFEKLEDHPEVIVERNPPEWKYVENLFAQPVIPKPIEKPEYPSGWNPPKKEAAQQEYFVERNKNFMIPVYLSKTHRGQRQITKLKRIEGDIWKLEEDLRKSIEQRIQKKIATRVNEMSRQIHIHGDHVEMTKNYLSKKGF